MRIGGKVYTTEFAVTSFLVTLSTDMKSVKPEVTDTNSPPQDSSLATASESLLQAKQHLEQVLRHRTRTEDKGKS